MVWPMRILALWAVIAISALGVSQAPPEASNSSAPIRPEVVVVVKKSQTGADLIQIKMLDPGYPVDLLAQQIEDFGRRLGSGVRGATPMKLAGPSDNPRLAFVTSGTFAVDGMIDRTAGRLRLSPLVQAFAGAPSPFEIDAMLILLENETPTPQTVRRFTSPAVEVRAEATGGSNMPGIEVRVNLLSQDPNAIQIPDRVEPNAPPAPSPPASRGVGWVAWTLAALASIAVGALVYFRLVRSGGR